MISREEYREKMKNLISEEDFSTFERIKKTRKKALVIDLSIEAALLAVAFAMFFINVFIAFTLSGVFVLSLVISLVIIFTALRFNFDGFRDKQAQNILEVLFDGYKFSFDPTKVISSADFVRGGFCGRFDTYSGEDLLEVNLQNEDGTPSETKLRLCDVSAKRYETRTYRDSNGNYHTETIEVSVFEGMFGYIIFPQRFNCKLSINSAVVGTKKIELEDIKFNKAFVTKTDNQIEALRILTTTMMKKLQAIQDQMPELLQFSIYDNLFFMAINGRNFFELDVKKGLSPEMFDRMYDDASNILLLLEEMKKNNKIFKV